MPWHGLSEAILENDYVLMRRISLSDREQLRTAALDPDIWRYFVFCITTDAEVDEFMNNALEDTVAGRRIVFSVICKADNCVAGSMCYGNLSEKEKRLEIGWSWLGRRYRGKGINRWAKYLLMEYAFEALQCERVEFKTDILNLQARKGLQNIGAKEEGVLRSYNFMPDGRRRDVVYYSVLRAEWADTKQMLLSTGRPGVRKDGGHKG